MNEFFSWLFDREQIFTIVTVVLSGLISWGISALYFWRSNRNSLCSEILYPMKRILEDELSIKNYTSLNEISSKPSTKYLKKREQKAIDTLLSTYKAVCKYKYEDVCADSLFSYFCYKLKQNGVEVEIEPIKCDDEIVNFGIPQDAYYDMTNSLSYIIEHYLNDEECSDMIKSVFKDNCKKYFTNNEISFFDDYSIDEVLSKAKNRAKWDEILLNYHNAKTIFLNLKAFKH